MASTTDPSLIQLDPAPSLAAGAAALRAAAARARTLTRFAVDVPATDPLAWLAARPPLLRFALAGDGSAMAAAGGALAHDVADLGELEDLTPRAPDTRLWLTARFDTTRPPAPEWRFFGRVRAVLPAVELRRAGARCTLACHAGGAAAATALALLDGMREPEPSAPLPAVEPATGDSEDAWQHSVARALEDLRAGQLDKVVLARRTRWIASTPPCPVSLTERLPDGTGMHRFVVQPEGAAAFAGSSPELLLRRTGRRIETMALAGTRPRGTSAADAARLAAELSASGKERLEHRLVLDWLLERLAPLCADLQHEPAPSVLALGSVQHLRTEVHGELRDGTSDVRCLALLHPTPAVCGVPFAAARARIAASEGFDRGLFAGLVGFLGRDETVVAVAIRSALLREREIVAFAGAGLVPGSSAAAEWRETDSKLAAIAQALGASG